MTYSEITITFTDDLVLNNALRLITTFNDATYVDEIWTWVTTRSSGYEVTTGTPTATVGERTAINFKTAFDLDYPTGYTTIQTSNEILIQSETSGEFFNAVRLPLGKGTISINNIGDESAITVMIPKYYVDYCDDFGTERQVLILKKAYVGLIKELLADVNPIAISYESSEDFKFEPIRPSAAEVFLIFDTEGTIDFEEFWTADERDFMVQDIKDGQIEWLGYVVPNGFQYEFRGGLYHASIEASDGLASLESITFVDDNQKPYGNQDLVYNNEFEFPFSLIITEILKKLGLDLDLWVCVDSYESTMTKTGDVRDADPLSSSYVNVKTYIKEGENKEIPYWFGSGEEWNCKEVMENILYIFGAKLYQEWGVWRIKTINADIDYGSGATQRYWRKYNTVGTYLFDYEVIDDEIEIPCNNPTKFLLGNDHVMRMDVVYKAFRMNYEYQFLRYGDNPLDILPNGDFCDFPNTSILAAPTGWERWRRDNKWYIRLQGITIPFADAGGHTCGIEIGTQKTGIPTQQGSIKTDPNPAIWTSLTNTNLKYVEKGSNLTLNAWAKYLPRTDDPPSIRVSYYPVFRMMLITDDEVYFLRNSIVDNVNGYTWELGQITGSGGPIGPGPSLRDVFFYLDFQDSKNGTPADINTYDWWQFEFDIGETPTAGVIDFHIHGLADNKNPKSNAYPPFPSYKDGTTFSEWLRVPRDNWADLGGTLERLQLTGVRVGVIPNENELPQSQDFIYENQNDNYTLQVDPITIYNGDLQDQYHISNIIVPTNTGGKNFWDDLSDAYGSSSLGLLTVREIMRQYQNPYRILEGNIKIQDARFGTVYTFEVLPDVRFILQRGTFNKQKQYIENVTFIQLSSDTLPDGGTEGGNTLDPNWQPTGNFYCQIDETFLNTGYVITEEMDTNPNSETYQDTREVVSTSQDLDTCPLGQPRLWYWGHDDIYLNVFTLNYSPFTQISEKEIQVNFDNIDNNYLYFVHLKSLGVIDQITTLTSPGNVLSDWVYLADTIIDGYIYRVLRTDYVMTEFTNFTHNFKLA